jgi:hypothetical protein
MPSNSKTEIVWHRLRVSAKRLERYSYRVKEKIWLGTRDDLVSALAEVAETGEIARRLYSAVQEAINDK